VRSTPTSGSTRAPGWSGARRDTACPFRLLGPLAVIGGDGRPVPVDGAKARAVLALLLLEPGRSVPVELLIDALWGPSPPPSARGTLQAHVSRLRGVLRAAGAGEVVGHQGCYALRVDPDLVDAGRLERLVAGAGHLPAPVDRVAALTDALTLVRGPALADLRYLDAFTAAAERLDDLVLAATEERIDAELAAGDHFRVVSRLPALIEGHPYRERLHGHLMLGLYRCGRQAEALRAYQSLYRRVADEIGVVPSAPLRALEQAIAVQDPRLDLTFPAATVGSRAAGPAALPPGLGAVWRDLLAGRRRLAVVSRPPDPGTIDPLAGFLAQVGDAGALVLDVVFDDPCPTDPFRPFTLALESAGPGAAPHPVGGDDPVSARYRYFEAFAGCLQQAAATRPVILRLRDLHRAGRSALLLIEHVVRHHGRAPVLPVTDVDGRGGRLGAFLLRLQRDDLVAMIDDAPLAGAHEAGEAGDGPAPVDFGNRAVAALRDALHLAEHAGNTAMARLGFEEAAEYYGAALDTLALVAPDDAGHRAHLLIARGGAEQAAYRLPRSLATFRAAVAAAVAAGDDDLLAEAAVGLASGTEYAMADEETLAILERALAGVGGPDAESGLRGPNAETGLRGPNAETGLRGPNAETGLRGPNAEAGLRGPNAEAGLRGPNAETGRAVDPVDPADRVRLLAGIARLRPAASPRALEAAADAVRLARRGDDRPVLAHALAIHVQATWSPRTAVDRLAALDEIVALADDLQSLELAGEARNWRAATYEELGRMGDAERDAAIVAAWADQARLPFVEGLAALRRTAHHIHAGRLDAAEALLAQPPAPVADSPNFRAGFLLQHLVVQRLRGRSGDMVEAARAIVGEPGALPGWRVVLPLLLAEASRTGEAADELHRVLPLLDTLAEDWLWLGAAIHLADAAIVLSDAAAAAVLARQLAPFAGRQVVVAHGVILLGSVRARLGALAVLGTGADLDRAETHLRAGVAEEAAWGALPRSIASRALLAEVLARRGGADRRRESGALLAGARRDAGELGVSGFEPLLVRATAAGHGDARESAAGQVVPSS
jgi:DNA-binding SARP family transcriptional activator